MIACHALDPMFNLLLFGLVLTVIALLGVLLYLGLSWPREQRTWPKPTAPPRTEDRPTGSPRSYLVPVRDGVEPDLEIDERSR